jgi:hypothetical protein
MSRFGTRNQRRAALGAACLLGWPAHAASPARQSAEADFERGAAYDAGKLGAPDAHTALTYYARAAAAELPEAQLNTAVMLDSARGTPRDAAQAAIWYAAAAAHGDGRAAYDMGQLYESGDGVPRNEMAARAWFAFAASHGIEAAVHKHVADTPTATTLAPAVPARPDGLRLQPQGHDIALVWSAPSEPKSSQPVSFYIQLVIRAGTGQRMIYAGFANVTSTLVTLPAGENDFAWRTLTVSASGGHYVASPWAKFSAKVS